MVRRLWKGPLWRRVVVMPLCACLWGCLQADSRSSPSSGSPLPSAPPPHGGPIVLITLDALRGDVVGALGGPPGLTPNLDRLAAEATWAARAVAPSSWTVPSMASLFTGLMPWKHQALHAGQARLRDELLTLPEALRSVGYVTSAYRSNHWLTPQFGYGQGFDFVWNLNRGKRAAGHLQSLRDERSFLWIHILPPHTPYVLRRPFLDRVPHAPGGLPDTVRPLDLEPFFDPLTPMPEELGEKLWALYCINVAWADSRLGELLEALRQSGQWDRTLLVVTSDHGEEFGENGQSGHGGNLGRALLEVPLFVKLPAGFEPALAVAGREPVATVRLWATLLQAAGVEPIPAAAPSLFRELRDEEQGALSELYLGNGINRFSLVRDGYQLHWESRFADPEPEYYRARWTSLGGHPEPPLSEPVEEIFSRLEGAFTTTLPLTGIGEPRLRLERWLDARVEPVEDPRRARELARLLRRKWLEYVDEERPLAALAMSPPRPTSPEDAQKLRSLGYVTP